MNDKAITNYLLDKESFFWTPDYLDISAWIEHIPFAFWIIEVLKPKVVVELGVHNGPSYFAFCQAVKKLDIIATCYGVDTWKGDEHSGFYEEEVFDKVMEYNTREYSRFSTLIRSTFDEAKDYFVAASIDLLHIDGLHTYEAVKHDFEAWRPKLTAKSIVIFHDINVREKGFGVFKLWEELKQEYNSFQFDFGHGLGILIMNEVYAKEIGALSDLNKDEAYYIFLRNLFSERGSFFKTKFEGSLLITQERENLNARQADFSQSKEDYTALLAAHEKLAEDYVILETRNRQVEENYSTLTEKNEKLKEEYKASESDNQGYIAELTKKLENTRFSFDLQMAQARRENDVSKKHLAWFKKTFEDRSLFGVIKEKLKSKFKKIYIGFIDSQLKKEGIQKKYAVSYSLGYIRENGLRYSITKISEKLKKEGLKSISRTALREKAIKKLAITEMREIPNAVPNVPFIDTESIKKSITGLKYAPKISIIFPTYNIKPSLLELAIQSVKNQIYVNWELCIVDDCSTKPETIEVLKKYEADKNIKVLFLDKNSGISEASNAAISISTGEYIALMDHDDEIPPDALFWVINELNQYPDTDIIYSDECKIDEAGILSDYFYKPDWSPELLMNMMYTGHLTVYNKAFLVNDVGLFRKEYDFSQDYDLMLRASEKTDKIRHIPRFLYYWRITEGSAAQGDKPYARVTNLAALADAGKRRGLKGEIFEFPVANRLKIKVLKEKKVSLIIPTDSYVNLKETIESIQNSTTYLNYEIIPVTNSKLVKQMKELSYDNISYCNYDKPFNFSDKCNAGALHATGEIIVFFNDDVRPLQNDWIENTIEFFEIPEIGGISPKLLYENDTIQYAGMITGVRNLTGTSFHCHHKDATLYLNYPQLVRNVSILSGACLAMRKEIFLQLGGFDIINTPVGHSDVDLSFKILEAGYRCVYTPYATLRHVGHLSLKEHEKEEQNKFKKDKADIFLLKRWIKYLDKDRYFPVGMRDLLYIDSPEPFQLYTPNKEQVKGERGDVILVSHDLSLSGAPIMLYDTAKVLTEQGYFVIIFCPADGPLRKMYQDAGIPVIVDELVLQQHHTFERFAKNFDYIICNTVVTWSVVKQMQHIVKTIWWIQEGQAVQYFANDDDFITTIRSAQHLVGVSDYNISFVKPYNNKIAKIYNACYDLDCRNDSPPGGNEDKIIFTLVGSIERRKGHDVLIEALETIDPSLLRKAEVWFIGRTLKEHYLKSLFPRMNNIGIIKMLGEKSHDECLELMKQSDVILNISRDDPFPVVLVEAMCMGKTCIASTNSGLAELIINGENGFVFKNEDSADLGQKMTAILQNDNKLEVVGARARKTYEEHLTIEIFSDKLEKYMQQIEEAELV
jgi:GT2 family glycosyltransferase